MANGFFYKKGVAEELIISLLALLFIYAGCSKLLNMADFAGAMAVQPFAGWIKALLSNTLPYAEIVIAVGLLLYKSRQYAPYMYALLLLLFTSYSGLALFHYFKTVPCSCGGIIEHLDWKAHFILNLVFCVLTIVATALHLSNKLIVHNQEVS